MTAPYYRPSNRAPRAGVAIVVLVALLALPLAWLYAWLTSRLPMALGPFVLCVVCACLGWLVRSGAARGKIRHPRFMAWSGAGIGLLAWYVQWAAWLAIEGLAPAGADPAVMVRAISGVLEGQTSPWLAWGLVLCWIVECGAWLVLPMVVGRRQASAPFCEASGSWAKKIEVPVQFAFIAQPEVLRTLLENEPGQLEAVLVPCTDDFSGDHARLTLYRCAGPDSFVTLHNYVTMTAEQAPLPADVRRTLEASGDQVEYYGEDDEPVLELLRVPMPDPDGLLRRWEQAAQALPAPQIR